MSFSHLDDQDRPAMVDVSGKAVTVRTATARARVVVGNKIMQELEQSGFTTKKGSIIQTAIIAATMAVKQTWSIIPLCHPLPIQGCKVEIEAADDASLEAKCTVKTEGKTGVEMEALHGASVAALTVYDMCKAMSHGIVIEQLRLESKRGGKSDFDRG